MQLIESKTLASAAASIEFTSIPQDGTDLILFASIREATTTSFIVNIRFNGDTATNFSTRYLQGSGSSVVTAEAPASTFDIVANSSSETSNTFGNLSMYIANYTSSLAKSASSDSVSENNATQAFQRIASHLWAGTAGITTITAFTLTGNLAAGSTISLYKITKGSDGIVTTS